MEYEYSLHGTPITLRQTGLLDGAPREVTYRPPGVSGEGLQLLHMGAEVQGLTGGPQAEGPAAEGIGAERGEDRQAQDEPAGARGDAAGARVVGPEQDARPVGCARPARTPDTAREQGIETPSSSRRADPPGGDDDPPEGNRASRRLQVLDSTRLRGRRELKGGRSGRLVGVLEFLSRRRAPGLGIVAPDEPDARDLLLAAAPGLTQDIPEYVHNFVDGVPTRWQGGTSSCVGFCVSRVVQAAYLLLGLDCPELSPGFPYFVSRASHGDAGLDMGTYTRTAIKATQKFGIPSAKAEPWSERRVNRSPRPGAWGDAYSRRGLRRYYRIQTGDERGVRLANANKLVVIGGFKIDEYLQRRLVNLSRTDVPRVEVADGRFVGLHCMAIEGHDGGDFLMWNTSWGGVGRFRGSRRYAVDEASDLWAVDVRLWT
jgi:hypothetical protein